MLLQKEKILKLMWQKGITAKYLASTLMVSGQCLRQVLLGRKRLGFNRSRLMIEMFGAYAIADAIDWERMGKVNPFAEIVS